MGGTKQKQESAPSGSSGGGEGAAAFAQHTQRDAAHATAPISAAPPQQSQSMTLFSKLAVFVVFPLLMGVLGLYLAYLERLNKPERELSFDQDFVFPFLLALAMVVVIWVQTNGFTEKKFRPLVQWPQAKRIKRVVHKKDGRILTSEEVAKLKKND